MFVIFFFFFFGGGGGGGRGRYNFYKKGREEGREGESF